MIVNDVCLSEVIREGTEKNNDDDRDELRHVSERTV